MKEFNEAESIINTTGSYSGNAYLDASFLYSKGSFRKKIQELFKSKDLYEDGITAIAFAGDFGNEYCGYAYLG
jgi:hypothetical protein